MSKIKVGIVGAAGYTGGELIRVLLQHSNVEISMLHSRSNAGKLVSTVHDDLFEYSNLFFTDALIEEIDALFLCLGHGESRIFLKDNPKFQATKIIDLTNDFRINNGLENSNIDFLYGLAEYNKSAIANANAIANPGCFATAIQLSLLPLIHQYEARAIYITGITGSTGAGQSLSKTSHFSWRQNNVQAYKTLVHQHLDEIGKTINAINSNWNKSNIHFVPWRGDFARGIFVSTQLKVEHDLATIITWYKHYYEMHPFTMISDSAIHLKQVVNTNKCLIHLEMEDDNLVIHAAIDNLLKGAVGQAVQNMNLMFGLDERLGLRLKPIAF